MRFLIVLALLLAFAAPVLAADWPMEAGTGDRHPLPVIEIAQARSSAPAPVAWCAGIYDASRGTNLGSCTPQDYNASVQSPGTGAGAPGGGSGANGK